MGDVGHVHLRDSVDRGLPVAGEGVSPYFGTRRSYDGRISSYHAGLTSTARRMIRGGRWVVVMVEPLQVARWW